MELAVKMLKGSQKRNKERRGLRLALGGTQFFPELVDKIPRNLRHERSWVRKEFQEVESGQRVKC